MTALSVYQLYGIIVIWISLKAFICKHFSFSCCQQTLISIFILNFFLCQKVGVFSKVLSHFTIRQAKNTSKGKILFIKKILGCIRKTVSPNFCFWLVILGLYLNSRKY